MVSVIFAQLTRAITRRDTTGRLLSLGRVARSRDDSCVRAGITVRNLFRDKFGDARLDGCESNVTRGSLNSVKTSSCVWNTSNFMTLSRLHA